MQKTSSLEILSVEPLENLSFKGKCWVGDPCYVIDEDNWDLFCSKLYPNHECVIDSTEGGMVVTNKGKFFICGTAYGDGCYPLTKKGDEVATLGVDAGMLAIIPVEMLDDANCTLGHIVEVNGRVRAEGGNFSCGDIEVKTCDDEEEETSMWDDTDEDCDECDDCEDCDEGEEDEDE